MQKLRHIKQKSGTTDCGIACVRSLTGASELEVRFALAIKKNSGNPRTLPKQVRAALELWDFRMLREAYCDSWDKLPRGLHLALLVVNYHESSDEWHWVVLDRSVPDRPILDPLNDARSEIDRRSHLFSYYRLEPPVA